MNGVPVGVYASQLTIVVGHGSAVLVSVDAAAEILFRSQLSATMDMSMSRIALFRDALQFSVDSFSRRDFPNVAGVTYASWKTIHLFVRGEYRVVLFCEGETDKMRALLSFHRETFVSFMIMRVVK